MNALGQTNVVDLSAALAADLAANIYPQDVVFRNHGIDPTTGGELLSQPWFKAMVDQARRDWDSLANAKDRIRTKAQIALEEAISSIYSIIQDTTAPSAARVSAFKEMKEIAGMSVKEMDASPSFVPVQIFLNGASAPPVTIAGKAYTRGNNESDDIEDAQEAVEEQALPTPPSTSTFRMVEDV